MSKLTPHRVRQSSTSAAAAASTSSKPPAKSAQPVNPSAWTSAT